ncbi:hypothetical protein HYZ70_03445 [Candidatus Curtissbacteria bacterium]|nr:hypothetical protein [Candidatus Curtissbacteria bacterium]
MAVVVVEEKITLEQLALAKEEYGEFIKVVVDIEKEILAAGGEWHADAEKILLEQGSRQEDLWGGGINLNTRQITFTALINMRPKLSRSQEVLDQKIREIMGNMIKSVFGYE